MVPSNRTVSIAGAPAAAVARWAGTSGGLGSTATVARGLSSGAVIGTVPRIHDPAAPGVRAARGALPRSGAARRVQSRELRARGWPRSPLVQPRIAER